MVHGHLGGSAQLRELIDAHGEDLLADFQQFYNLDLADVWRGRIEIRRARVLAEQLKAIPESRYRAADLGDPRFLGFGWNAMVTADLYNLIVCALAALCGKKASAKDLYPRPQTSDARETVTVADFDIDGFMENIGS